MFVKTVQTALQLFSGSVNVIGKLSSTLTVKSQQYALGPTVSKTHLYYML